MADYAGSLQRAQAQVEDRNKPGRVEGFIQDLLKQIHTGQDMAGIRDDPRTSIVSEHRFREYVSAYDERLKSEMRARRKPSPKEQRDLANAGHPLVEGFLEKVRLQDQQLPEYLKESRA